MPNMGRHQLYLLSHSVSPFLVILTPLTYVLGDSDRVTGSWLCYGHLESEPEEKYLLPFILFFVCLFVFWIQDRSLLNKNYIAHALMPSIK